MANTTLLSKSKILDDLDTLISANNLQFVEHNVQEEVLGDKISITFNIFEGEKTLVERINILETTLQMKM